MIKTEKTQKKKLTGNILISIFMWIGAVVAVIPFLWAVSCSLQAPGLAYKFPPRFFMPEYMFSNFTKVLAESNFLRYGINSVFLCVVNITGRLLSCSIVAFGFAKLKFKGSNFLFFCALATMMLPGNVLAIPRYVMFCKVGALNTYIPLTIGSFFGDAFGIFLMRQAFLGIPNALYEAATLDGAKVPAIFVKIYLPMVKPMFAVLGLQTFMSVWNDLFNPMLYISDKAKYPLTLGMLHIKDLYPFNVELQMAGAVIMIIPILILYAFLQRYFVEGLASAAVKG